MLGDKRYGGAAPSFECIQGQDQSCAFRDIYYVDFFSNKTEARAHWRTNSHPTTWRLSAPVEAYQKTGTEDQKSTYNLQFGRNVLIAVPDKYEVIHITGTTITKEPIDLVVPSSNDFMTVLDHGVSSVIVYFVNRPAGVD